MSDRSADLQVRVEKAERELESFERQATTLLSLALALSVAGYAILIQLIP